MNQNTRPSAPMAGYRPYEAFALAVIAAFALSACGGATDEHSAAPYQAEILGEDVVAQPAFHLAPVLLDDPVSPPTEALAPDGAPDQVLTSIAGQDTPHTQTVLPEFEGLGTRGLLPEDIVSGVSRAQASAQGLAPQEAVATPVRVYTPAQIRAAYKLPVASTATPPTAAARAAMGAGQTIYIIGAYSHPKALTDLARHSATFGLQQCSAVAVSPTAANPLPAIGNTTGCTVSVVYASATGAKTAAVPAYNAAWATEVTMDLQAAHVMAPMARLVVISAPTNAVTSLYSAVNLANKMGKGIVSMSFGAAEGSWATSYDAYFKVPGMRYLAATGDSGMAVNWPSVSASVLAVGGTTLVTATSTNRVETAWAKTGGGISKYVGAPAYQEALPLKSAYRQAADVAFAADPYTGQYISVTSHAGVSNWVSGGGTSIAAPAWAGVLAAVEAQRALTGKAALADLHTALYKSVLPVYRVYTAGFRDVTTGANGTCSTCAAKLGFDTPTGLGTPNVAGLLSTLSTLAH